jgi:cellulose synthase/poly-beta-1,6-N-acetylglucosamine synthase-like glycosyltransferase
VAEEELLQPDPYDLVDLTLSLATADKEKQAATVKAAEAHKEEQQLLREFGDYSQFIDFEQAHLELLKRVAQDGMIETFAFVLFSSSFLSFLFSLFIINFYYFNLIFLYYVFLLFYLFLYYYYFLLFFFLFVTFIYCDYCDYFV